MSYHKDIHSELLDDIQTMGDFKEGNKNQALVDKEYYVDMIF